MPYVRPGGSAPLSPTSAIGDAVLDNPGWASLTGWHAALAHRQGRAARFLPDVSPFAAIADDVDDTVWADLAELVGVGGTVAVTGAPLLDGRVSVPPDWLVMWGEGVQLVGTQLRTGPDPDAVVLTREDVPEMLDLVARTQPGPFLPRTHELGTYLGIRRDGALVAMAGERLHPPGWTEISAVCTDASVRGQGLASRLVRAVGHGVRARGETPFLHAAADNVDAIRLYLSLGFTLRRRTAFVVVTVPQGGAG